MKVKGTHVIRETVEVDVDPKEIIHKLFMDWKQNLPDGKKIEWIDQKSGKWVYEEGDYHSDWDVSVRDATEEEIEQYKAFKFIESLIK